MKKTYFNPRADWQQKCNDLGFFFHSIDGKYWIEEYAIEMSEKEVNKLKAAGAEVHAMLLDMIGEIVKKGDFEKYQLPAFIWAEIEKSWNLHEFDLYSRFDFSFAGDNVPKLLEYNADTPTSIIESSTVQANWLKEAKPGYSQFNQIIEKMIARWKKWDQSEIVHFACDERSEEDWCNLDCIHQTAILAGLKTHFTYLNNIEWNPELNVFLDDNRQQIHALFKLYPWEFLIEEAFYPYIKRSQIKMIEPMWKMLLSTKAILPLLWEKYPQHPNLLPAFFSEEEMLKVDKNYVKKPILSREGAGITIYQASKIIDSGKNEYGKEGYVYQQRYDLVEFDNRYSVFGVWMSATEPMGLAIREDYSLITKDTSWFIPHYIA